jgi:hypothetical protein
MTRCLSLHRDYACRHSGACCTAGWPIPVEAGTLGVLEHAVADGRLAAPRGADALWLRPANAPADTPALVQADDQGCVFFDAARGRRCRIHAVLGPTALPVACREFPRISILEPRGASVTLSHYCPTAAALLEHDVEVVIATDPSMCRNREPGGLDVRDHLPPLLRPGMLMDWDAWWACERRAVDLLTRRAAPAANLATLAAAVENIRAWHPDEGPLALRVERAFLAARPGPARHADGDRRLSDVLSAVPSDLRPRGVERPGRPGDAVIGRFLAAHAFANWTAHLGGGLRSWLRSIEAAYALIDGGLGVRQTDLLLRHLADAGALSETFSRAESG